MRNSRSSAARRLVSLRHIFPSLTPVQIARIKARGRVRPIAAGEVLLEAGAPATRMFVVTSGRLEVVRLGHAEQLVAEFRAGQFTGEMNTLSGRPSVGQVRASDDRSTVARVAETRQCVGTQVAETCLGARPVATDRIAAGRPPNLPCRSKIR